MTTEKELAERVREILHYDPETGIFTRKVRLAQRHQAGDRACGNPIKGGHLRVAFDSTKYLAHRLAWLYIHGEWPKGMIDHINGNPADNRLANLRDVNARINMENIRRARASNKSGYLGVYWHGQNGKWVARIQVDKKGIYIGCFDDPKDAHEAYLEYKRKLHEGCTI